MTLQGRSNKRASYQCLARSAPQERRGWGHLVREGETETWALVLVLPPWLGVLGQVLCCPWVSVISSVSELFCLILEEKNAWESMNFSYPLFLLVGSEPRPCCLYGGDRRTFQGCCEGLKMTTVIVAAGIGCWVSPPLPGARRDHHFRSQIQTLRNRGQACSLPITQPGLVHDVLQGIGF